MKKLIKKNKGRIGLVILTLILSFICSFRMKQLSDYEERLVYDIKELQRL